MVDTFYILFLFVFLFWNIIRSEHVYTFIKMQLYQHIVTYLWINRS